MLRGLEQKTKIIEGSLAPEVFGWDNVDVPITLNYYRKTSLPIIFKQIEKIFGIIIVVDHKELHRVNLSFDQLQGTVRANKITLNEALEQLLASVDEASLTYRIVGSNIIELTTTHSAKQPDKMSVEVHTYAEAVLKFVKLNTAAQQREAVVQGQSLPPIPAPVYKIEKQTPKNNVTNNDSEETDNDDNKTPEQIVENLRAIIEPTSWNDVAKANNTIDKNNNKNLPDKGNIVIDHSSSCLIIRQTQPIQRQIRTWLNSVTGKLRP
jgi:hypothetical protein